jgi:hypothetical protein
VAKKAKRSVAKRVAKAAKAVAKKAKKAVEKMTPKNGHEGQEEVEALIAPHLSNRPLTPMLGAFT